MSISKAERLARRLGHSKQERLQVGEGVPNANQMKEGVSVLRQTSDGLIEYVKYNGVIFKGTVKTRA